MREAAGQTVKSSIFHTWTKDTRDDTLFGTRGYFAKLSSEYAGLGGDAAFFKTEGSGHFARPLLPGAVRVLPSC